MPNLKTTRSRKFIPDSEHSTPDFDSDFSHNSFPAPKETPVAGGFVINQNTKERIHYLRFDRESGWLYRKTDVEQEYHNQELEKLLNKTWQVWNNNGKGKPYQMIELLSGGFVFLPRKKSAKKPQEA